MLKLIQQFMEKNDLKITVLVPLILAVVGIFIINFHLENYYSIIDYNIFKVQSIYVGAMFVIFLGLTFIYFHWFDSDSQSKISRIFIILTKIAIASLSVFVLPKIGYEESPMEAINPGGLGLNQIRDLVKHSLVFTGLYFIIVYFLKIKQPHFYGKLKVFRIPLGFLISLCAIIAAILILRKDHLGQFTDLVLFFSVTGISYLLLKEFPGFDPQKIRKTASLWLCLSCIFFTLVFYTKGVYPFLPKSFGGGEVKPCQIYYKSSKEQGDQRSKPALPKAEIVHRANGILYILDWRDKKKRIIHLIQEKDVEEIVLED